MTTELFTPDTTVATVDIAPNLHTRFLALDDLEIQSRGKGGDGRTVIAYAAVFDTPGEVQDQDGHYLEQHSRGAFVKTISERGPKMGVFYNHGKTLFGTPSERGAMPIGTPIDMREDGRGWLTRTRYNKTPLAEEVLEAIKAGSIRGMSYTGRYLQSDPLPPYYSRAGELMLVTRKEVAVREYGPTPIPVYEGADIVGVRAQQPDAHEVIRVTAPAPDAAEAEQTADPPDGETTPSDAPGQGASSVSDADEVSVDSTEEGTPAADTGTGAAAPAAEPAETTEEPQPHSEDRPHERSVLMDAQAADQRPAEAQTMTVEERKARKSEIRARAAEIDNEFNGAVLPDDIQNEWDRIHVEFEQHSRAIEASLQRQEQLARIAENPNAVERADTGNGDGGYRSRGMPATYVRPDNIYDLTEVRNRARSLDELPGLYRDRALRAVEVARYPGVDNKEDAQSRASHLLTSIDDGKGELARRMIITGSPTYERAFFKAVVRGGFMGLNAEEQRALTMGAADSAGLAVPFSLDPTIILTSAGVINPLRTIARVETITGKTWQGVTSAGITVTRAAESAEVGDNAPTLAQPEVTPQRVHAFVPFSIEAEQDWSQLRSEMTRLLNDGKETEEATSFVTGDGTGVNPDGVVAGLAAGSLVTANTITAAGVYALEEALPPRFRPRARFLGSKSVYNAIRQLDTAGGAQLWARIGAGQPSELLGYPAHESSAMADSSLTIADRWLLFGDFNNFLIVDKAGMNVELVPHLLHTGNNRPYGHRGLYAIWRNSSLILVDNAFRVANKAA